MNKFLLLRCCSDVVILAADVVVFTYLRMCADQ